MTIIGTPLFWHKIHNAAPNHPKTGKSKDLHRQFDFMVDGKMLRLKIKSTTWVLRGGKPSRSMRFKIPDLFEYSFIINYARDYVHGVMIPEEIISSKLTYFGNDKEYIEYVLLILLLSI